MTAIVIPTAPTTSAPAMPTAKGFRPTPLNTAKFVFSPTAAIAVPNKICDAQKSPSDRVIDVQSPALQTPNAAPFDITIQSPTDRTTAIARNPITNPGTSDTFAPFAPVAPDAPDAFEAVDLMCIHVSIGITAARKMLRVSLVTVAT